MPLGPTPPNGSDGSEARTIALTHAPPERRAVIAF
jgi:hypothetical protein